MSSTVKFMFPIVGVVVIGVLLKELDIRSLMTYFRCPFTVKSSDVSHSESDTKLSQEKNIFTEEELRKYRNEETGIYLAILGEVYDVTKGKKYYAPGASYYFFTGNDGSRAFITGDFSKEGISDDVLDLNAQDLKSLSDWSEFYKQEYIFKGVVIGRYYDREGNPTAYKYEVEDKIEKARKDEDTQQKEKLMFPPCNVEWSQESGSRVWCTNMSGGIKRAWVGVPRKLYVPGSESHRCACVNFELELAHKKSNLKEYSNCNPKATSCYIGT